MAAIGAFLEGFAYAVLARGPQLTYRFSLYSFQEGAHTTEILPNDQEIIEDDGDTISVSKGSFFSVERGNVDRLYLGIASLRQRLFNEGSLMMVRRRSLRLHYGVERRAIERYLRRVARYIFRFLSDEQNSHRQSIVFCATFRCAFNVANMEAFRHNTEARILQESIESATYKARPATQEAVDGLEKTKIGDGSNFDSRDCAICIEELSPDGEHIRMKCKHVYHKDCIVAWLKRSHSCPVCRFSLPHD